MALRRHGGHDLALHLYMCAVHESVLRRGVSDLLVHHHDGHVVRALVLRRCTYAVRELVLHLYGNDLLARHRCTYAVRELDDLLHNDRGNLWFRLAFRHPCAVVFRKDSKRHYCALLRVLRRAVIQRGCEHLDRVVRVVHGIRLLPP
jgi:hypothetical protein